MHPADSAVNWKEIEGERRMRPSEALPKHREIKTLEPDPIAAGSRHRTENGCRIRGAGEFSPVKGDR